MILSSANQFTARKNRSVGRLCKQKSATEPLALLPSSTPRQSGSHPPVPRYIKVSPFLSSRVEAAPPVGSLLPPADRTKNKEQTTKDKRALDLFSVPCSLFAHEEAQHHGY
jgi:hypothetical protein